MVAPAAELDDADGVVALPGGCGTLEELLEAITWKRLGLHRSSSSMRSVVSAGRLE